MKARGYQVLFSVFMTLFFMQEVSALSLRLVEPYPQLQFQQPVAMVQAPGEALQWYLLEKEGRIWRFSSQTKEVSPQLFLDIRRRVESRPSEAGLLGMAFHPDYVRNRQVFLSYTRQEKQLVSHIARFTSRDKGRTLAADSEQTLLTVAQPYSNHNGGQIAFGPDGYLYIGFGDGGSGGDPQGHGQNTDTLLGALLRIDVNGGKPYAIPKDNPFVVGGGRPEIFVWGLRNPWRWSFDRETGDLWVGDVGQNDWEEVNKVSRGENYGWNIREGRHCYRREPCPKEGLTDPVAEYGHDQGCSVTGGYVYRGKAITGLRGAYVYGDFCSGRIWGLFNAAQGNMKPELLLDSKHRISAFAEDNSGELYLLDYATGRIFQLVLSEE